MTGQRQQPWRSATRDVSRLRWANFGKSRWGVCGSFAKKKPPLMGESYAIRENLGIVGIVLAAIRFSCLFFYCDRLG